MKRLLFIGLILVLIIDLSYGQCNVQSNTFTWEGTGYGNEATWGVGQTTGNSTVSGCGGSLVDVSISIDNPDGVYYTGTQVGTGTTGSMGPIGLEFWMDADNDLFNGVAMSPGDEMSFIFSFSTPVLLNDVTIADIDSRDLGGVGGVSSSWQDQVELTAVDDLGANVPLTVYSVGVGAGTITISGQTVTSVWVADADLGLDVDNVNGHATWSSNLPVKTLSVRYIAGPDEVAPGQQVIRINNFDFCCPIPSCSSALISNNGFEAGFTNWSDWGFVSISGDAAEGSSAMQISGGVGGFGQAISPITPGQTYSLSFFAKRSGNGDVFGGINVKDVENNTIYDYGRIIFDTVYSYHEFTITAPANASHLEVFGWNNDGATSGAVHFVVRQRVF